MRMKTLGAIALAGAMLVSGIAFNAYRSTSLDQIGYGPVRLYKNEKDRSSVVKVFKDNFYALTANPDHDFDVMLQKRSPNRHETKYFGKMNTVVLYDGDTLAGFVSYYMKSTYAGKVLFLGIDKQFRRKGYGKKLMNAALDALKKQGAKVIKIATRSDNTAAQALYGNKLGFTKEDEKDGFVFYRKDV
jgi:ribosomal protein S18 acetylase RimI-like enzyme